MSVALTGSGGLFTALGKIGAAQRTVYGHIGTADPSTTAAWGSGGPAIKPVASAINDILTQLAASAAPQLANGVWGSRDSYREVHQQYLTDLQQLAQSLVIELVHADAVLPSKTLPVALKELIRQMVAGSATLTKNTVSATVAAVAGNTGDAVLICSLVDPTGVNREHVLPEVLDAVVTADGQQDGGATVGAEVLTITGELATTGELNWQWPDGSSSANTVTLVNPSENASTNLLTNSAFEAFTAHSPDNWAIVTGTANTSIFGATGSNAIRSTGSSLQFLGDGAELTAITQTFNSTLGTTSNPKPLTVYGVNCWHKISTGAVAGNLTLSLVDVSGTVINDDAGTANTVTQNLALSSNSTFTAINGFFRTPSVMPSTVKLRLKLTTALSSGKSVYIDDLAMAEAAELYASGPLVVAFRGGLVDVVKDDAYTITVANNGGGTFQQIVQQNFDMRSLRLMFPTAASGTIANTLVA